MRKTILHHDLETRSAIDLNLCGQYAYAMSASTSILTFSWAINDGKITTWYPFLGEPMPKELEDAMLDPEVELGAHNASFERILQVTAPARPQKFLPDKVVKAIRPLERWNCTAARAAYMGLPRSLEKAALALNLPINKDLEGKKLMLKMCKPTGRAQNGSYLWHMNDEDLFREGQYCEQDVAVERGIDTMLPQLPPAEREVWMATERMNDRGVQVDDELLLSMILFVNEAEARVNRNIKEFTNGLVPKVTNSKKMLEWIHAQGYTHLPSGAPIKGVGKDVIRDLLANDGLPDQVREVLLTRQEGNKSSSSKYKAVLMRINADKRIRGSMVYCGAASTHRFSSRGAQLQNLPRGGTIKDIDGALLAVLAGATPDDIANTYGAPMVVASELVRPTFVSPKNFWLARGDYAQVELRTGAFLAGQRNALQGFADYDTILGYDEKGKPKRKGPDRYRVTASGIFQVPVSEIDDAKRQGGKIGDLACIAKGSLVTTDRGLIPIEDVTTEMRVWDGIEWVHHDGVVSRGDKYCVTYQGLTATPDHLVFLEESDEPATFKSVFKNQRRLRGCSDKLDEPWWPIHYHTTAHEVFDIVNAGPRHRFTVSGRLVHNCGFGGGKGAFQAFAKIYNFNVSDTEAQTIVDGWRGANPYVVQFWQDLEDNAMACMREKPGVRFVVKTIRGDIIGGKPKHTGRPYNPGLWFVRGKSALILRLPSGNCLFYWYPKIEKKMTSWGESWQVTYMAEDSQTKQWKRWSLWGGLICENAVQSFARDIMARAIVRMDKSGLSPVLTVHDEGIGQIPFEMAATAEEAAELVRIDMLAVEDWYAKMPLAVDASAGPRYAKA